jgi:hypothetical protein
MTVQNSTQVRNASLDSWQYGAITGQSGATNWAQSTGYTAFTSWIQNGGSIYLSRASGTSASGGTGPAGTGTNITDGTGSLSWVFIGDEGMGTSVKLQVFTGVQPASCAASEAGTLLVEFDLGSHYAGLASGGVKALSNLPIAATAGNTGTSGHYRIYDSTLTTCHEQGSITLTGGGGDATIDNTSITSSQTINLTGFSMTEPGA